MGNIDTMLKCTPFSPIHCNEKKNILIGFKCYDSERSVSSLAPSIGEVGDGICALKVNSSKNEMRQYKGMGLCCSKHQSSHFNCKPF